MRMYIDEHQGHFPPRFPPADSTTGPYPCKSCRTTNWTVYLTQPNYLSLSNRVFSCPSDNGIPNVFPSDPFNTTTQTPRPKRLVELQDWSSSFCFNAVLTHLGVESALPQPSNTGMIGETFPWHAPKELALYALSTGTNRAVSQAIAVDGHSSRPTPADITAACKFFEVPGLGIVP